MRYFNIKTYIDELSKFQDNTLNEYREKYLSFYSFLTTEFNSGNNYIIIDNISDMKKNTYFFYQMVFDKQYLSNWNFVILKQLLYFWDLDGNIEELTKLYSTIERKQKKKTNEFILKYFTLNKLFMSKDKKKHEEQKKLFEMKENYLNKLKLEKEKNSTFFELLFFNDNIPFYTKDILQNWIKKMNNKFELLFFNIGMDNNINELELEIYQDILNNTGLYKNINFHNKVTSSNTTININSVKNEYLKDVDELHYLSLEQNFKNLEEELEIFYEEEDFKIFGSIYFVLNTKQKYIINEFKKQLDLLGIGTIEISYDKFLNNKNYNIISPHSLFKFNMNLQKEGKKS